MKAFKVTAVLCAVILIVPIVGAWDKHRLKEPRTIVGYMWDDFGTGQWIVQRVTTYDGEEGAHWYYTKTIENGEMRIRCYQRDGEGGWMHTNVVLSDLNMIWIPSEGNVEDAQTFYGYLIYHIVGK